MKKLLFIFLISGLSTQAQFTVKELCIQLQTVCLDSILVPQQVDIAFSDSVLYYYNGSSLVDVGSFTECQNRIKIGYGDFNGEPQQEDFIAVFGLPDYYFIFPLIRGNHIWQGSYIPELPEKYNYVKLKN
jgi:hypothetical protein